MALITYCVLPFQVASFTKSNCRDFVANDVWPQFTRLHSTRLSGLGAMLESYHKLQPMPKSVVELKDSLQLIWSALPEKAIDNSVKDYHKRLQTCVSASGGHFKHIM